MTIYTDSTLELNKEVPLVQKPNRLNTIWNSIPDLKIGDLFSFHSVAPDNNRLVFRHSRTGVQHVLSAILFLDSDRFYNGTRKENKTALFVNFPYEMKRYNSAINKTLSVRAGTIFDSFEKIDSGYLVKSNTGGVYFLPNYVGSPVCDIDFVEPQEVKDAFDELSALNVLDKLPVPVEEECTLKISFERKAMLDNFTFSSNSVADTVEEEVSRILALDLGEKDKENMLLLALNTLRTKNQKTEISGLHENT